MSEMTARPPLFRTRKISVEKLPLRFRLNQIEDAVGNDQIDRLARDERVLQSQLLRQLVRAQERSGVGDRSRLQFRIEFFQIEREVLNTALAKLDVGVTDFFRDHRRIASRHPEHLVCHIDADHFAARSDDLRRDEADLPGAAAEIENGFALAYVFARIAAAVIPLDHFLRNDFEVFAVVVDRATKPWLGRLSPGSVAFSDGSFWI